MGSIKRLVSEDVSFQRQAKLGGFSVRPVYHTQLLAESPVSNLFANLEFPVRQPKLLFPFLNEVQGLSWRDRRTPGKEIRMDAAKAQATKFGFR
jgi:hypothetical protein